MALFKFGRFRLIFILWQKKIYPIVVYFLLVVLYLSLPFMVFSFRSEEIWLNEITLWNSLTVLKNLIHSYTHSPMVTQGIVPIFNKFSDFNKLARIAWNLIVQIASFQLL